MFSICIKWFPVFGITGWWLYDLQVHWRSLVDYHYGWVVVLLVGFLVSERWPTRPMDERPASLWAVIALALAGTPFVLIAELYKHAVAPTPSSSFCLSIGCTLFITAFIVHLRGWSTWRHFAFPLLFLFVAVPIPKLLWNPVVLGLQSLIAALNVETLNLVGIPAQQSGNVIRLPRCLVGVDEACSGVRSLQSSIMVALFVGDLILRRWPARLAFLIIGIGLAITGNFLRSFYLSLTAHRYGPSALEGVHDTAGWTILAFTGVGLAIAGWVMIRVQKLGHQAARHPSGCDREMVQSNSDH